MPVLPMGAVKTKTILLASHSREDISVLCDTVTELEQGRVAGA